MVREVICDTCETILIRGGHEAILCFLRLLNFRWFENTRRDKLPSGASKISEEKL